jgi:hypothetical protein
VWPKAPRGTIYIEVTNPVTGASCTIELEHNHFGSMKVQMHNPQGQVHLCSPVQCVWSNQHAPDVAELERMKHYNRTGKYPPTA